MGTRTTYRPGAFCWTDLATTDSAAATDFYTALFGWEAEELPAGDAGAYTMLRIGEHDVAALYQADDRPPAWLSYVSVADADASAASAAALGGTVLEEPFDVLASGRMALIEDSTGAVFALWQPGDHAGAGLVNDPGALCLNQLNTTDPEVAIRFYQGLFGWRVEPVGTGAQPYWGLYNGDALNGGMMPLPPGGGSRSHWLVYFTVTSLDDAAERIAELGGRVLVPALVIESGRILVAVDPQGAALALFEGPVDA